MIRFDNDALDALRFAWAAMATADVGLRIERAKPINHVAQAGPAPYARAEAGAKGGAS